jgi:hypothetical protein
VASTDVERATLTARVNELVSRIEAVRVRLGRGRRACRRPGATRLSNARCRHGEVRARRSPGDAGKPPAVRVGNQHGKIQLLVPSA